MAIKYVSMPEREGKIGVLGGNARWCGHTVQWTVERDGTSTQIFFRAQIIVCVCYTGKGKVYHTPWGVLVRCSSPLLMPWAHRWINHLSLWRMASVTPDLRLPSQSQEIAAAQLVPNYTAWWQRHMCVNNLPKVVTWQRFGRELNSRPLESQDNTLTITPPGHSASIINGGTANSHLALPHKTTTLHR